jgi:hypothetical protein
MLREPIAFNIGGAMGLGAILTHAAHALRVGKAHGVDVALRFTSPIYRPTNGPHDWLESYFIRRGRDPQNKTTLDVGGLDFDYTVRDPHLPWSYLEIRPEIVSQAESLTADPGNS